MSTIAAVLALITRTSVHAPTSLPLLDGKAAGWLVASSDGYPWDSDTSKAGWALSVFGVALVAGIVVVLTLVARRRKHRG